MTGYKLYQGHALEVLKTLPDESVDMCMTSPPYWGLRSYKTEPIDWGDWTGELGLEPKIELYISHLIQIFSEVKRVLKSTGTCWVNIDDSYAGSWGAMSHDLGNKGKRTGYVERPNTSYPQSTPAKSLCLIPSRFALAMVNDNWILRNDLVWHKPNPMPESVKDRFTTSWEHLFFFSKSQKYYFEQQFEPAYDWGTRDRSNGKYKEVGLANGLENDTNPLGRNFRDVWTIPTQGYRDAHFATYPRKLCETPIKAGCPIVCKKCGRPRELVYERTGHINKREPAHAPNNCPTKVDSTGWGPVEVAKGYTDCGCNVGFEGGVVLDPFAGSGTTAEEAISQGKKAILIELNPKYCELIEKRLSKGIKMNLIPHLVSD